MCPQNRTSEPEAWLHPPALGTWAEEGTCILGSSLSFSVWNCDGKDGCVPSFRSKNKL